MAVFFFETECPEESYKGCCYRGKRQEKILELEGAK